MGKHTAQQSEASRALTTALKAAHRAGEIILAALRQGDFSVERKEDKSFVTTTDTLAEEAIFTAITHDFPGARFLSEESESEFSDPALTKGELWVIDPIDGTTNFSRGQLNVGVCIAYSVDGAVQCAVVHAPLIQETYTALRGEPAQCNGQVIRPRFDVPLDHALIVTGFPYVKGSLQRTLRRAESVLTHCYDLRRLGACSIDICWVARGRLDGYYETVKPWDIAAPGFIARMAGCTVGPLGKRYEQAHLPEELCGEEVLIASPSLFQQLQQVLSSP
ncbi:MAG: inositol monophosphatase family protein [Bdellovibrionota bacterium]|nr:MAG: inositol monophosphatase family protein [Bdellovibrionota bacterium]